jgi:endonuclease G
MNFNRYILMAFLVTGCATAPPAPVVKTKPAKTIPVIVEKPLEKESSELVITPPTLPKTVFIDHKFFKVAYDPERRLARYVVYQLTAENLLKKPVTRKDKFIIDPFLKEKGFPYVKPTEYKSTGYDRGHLAPSADFAWSEESNDITFVMSNMVPQSPGLNRGAWKKLEEQVRKWACGEKKVSIITGPILKRGLTKLKGGDLDVPQEFFKIVIDETPPVKIVSFLYSQTDKGDVMAERMMPINRLEKLAGIAFNDEIPEFAGMEERAPAAADEWKEADCSN